MNIVLVNPEYPYIDSRGHGGIATYIYAMADSMVEYGHKVSVLCRKGTIPDSHLNKGVKVYTFNFDSPSCIKSFFMRRYNEQIYWENGCSRAALNSVLKLHEHNPVDIVEIPEYNGLASSFSSHLPFRIVIAFHTPTILIDELNEVPISENRSKWYRYEKKALRNADAYRCPSNSLAEKIESLYSIRKKDITIIKNPLPSGIIKKINIKKQKRQDRFDILFSGRFERRKGAHLLCENIKKILGIGEYIYITIAGATEISNHYNYQLLIENSLEENERKRVWFTGSAGEEKLALLYHRSDMLLMPSLFENSPYTLLEAMIAKLPVVAADTGGINEIITNNENGYLFSLKQPELMCDCIKKLYLYPEIGEKLADKAYNYINKHHNQRTIAQQTIELYNNIYE